MTAMFIIAIVATLAAFLAVSQQVWLRQAQNMVDLGQADGIIRGAIDLAALVLIEDANKGGNIDTLNRDKDVWNNPITLPVDEGFVTIEVTDAQGLFNLNNLVTGTPGNRALNTTEIAVFEQLLTDLDIDPGLKNALVDWLDDNTSIEPNGAEDLDYINHSTPYRAANMALETVDELKNVKGFTPDIVDKLRNHVVALPEPTSVNVNTADPKTLAAVMRMPAATLASAMGKDANREFASKQDFDKQFPAQQNTGSHDVMSKFFMARIKVRVGRLSRSVDALLQRDGGKAWMLWQQPTRWQIAREEEPNA